MKEIVLLSDKQLRSIQLVQLEILLEVKRICEKENIRYNIIAGTLLGAVRHGGFIPWDDDADVAFLRSDYERFRDACLNELDTSRFYFQDHMVTSGYRWGYGKLRRKGTEFLRKNQEHLPYQSGIFIDIFPLDNVPDYYIYRCIHSAHCFLIRKILWSEVGRMSEKNMLLRLVYSQLARIPLYMVWKHYDRFLKKGTKNPTKWVRILTFPTPNLEFGYLRSWYERQAQYIFEGHSFSGIGDYDSYLRFKYKNYMEIPPESQRKHHPISKLSLLDEG